MKMKHRNVVNKISFRMMAAGILVAFSITALGCGSGNAIKDTSKKNDVNKEKEALLSGKKEFVYETNSMEQWQNTLTYTGEGVITMEGIRGIKVVRDGNDIVQISYEPRDYKNTYDCWAISKPYDSLAYVDTQAMYEYFSLIENMPLQVVEVSGEDAQDIDTFGVTAGEIYVAYYSMQTTDGGSPYPDQGVRFLFGDTAEDGYQYVRIDGMDTLFATQKEYADALLGIDPFQFVLQVVNVVMMDTVSELEIATQSDYLSMEYDGKDYQMNGKKISFDEYNAFYTELMTVFIDGEVPKGYQLGDEECMLALYYHRNVEGAPDISVQYFPYDEAHVVASINGKGFFMVEREAIETLIKKIGEK